MHDAGESSPERTIVEKRSSLFGFGIGLEKSACDLSEYYKVNLHCLSCKDLYDEVLLALSEIKFFVIVNINISNQ